MQTTFNGEHSATSNFGCEQLLPQQTNVHQDYPLLAWVTDELRKVDSLQSENELLHSARVLIRDALSGAPTFADLALAMERNRFRLKTA